MWLKIKQKQWFYGYKFIVEKNQYSFTKKWLGENIWSLLYIDNFITACIIIFSHWKLLGILIYHRMVWKAFFRENFSYSIETNVHIWTNFPTQVSPGTISGHPGPPNTWAQLGVGLFCVWQEGRREWQQGKSFWCKARVWIQRYKGQSADSTGIVWTNEPFSGALV